MSVPVAAIVAVAENGVIGNGNQLPWHISSDLKRFRALTWGKPLIMGRKTFASLGRVLPGRETIVVTRDTRFIAPPGIFVAGDPGAALALAATRASALGADEIIVAGGSEIFAALMHRIDRLHVTYVALAPEGDAFFPPIDWSQWCEISRAPQSPQKGDEAAFTFVDYVRRREDADERRM